MLNEKVGPVLFMVESKFVLSFFKFKCSQFMFQGCFHGEVGVEIGKVGWTARAPIVTCSTLSKYTDALLIYKCSTVEL
jgi:hypothetical protein